MDVFFSDEDRSAYLDLLSEQGDKFGLTFLAWCLMPNHVHLVAVPEHPNSLARGIGEAHKRYSRRINFRMGSRGYLFQGRFFSCPLGGDRILAAIRYVLQNPVRAGIVGQAWRYPWSSAGWMVGDVETDPLVQRNDIFQEVGDWRSFLAEEPGDCVALRRHTCTGRPLGGEGFIERAERLTGRSLHMRKRGRRSSK